MDRKYKDIHITRKGIDIYVYRMCQNVEIRSNEEKVFISFLYQINENVNLNGLITLNLTETNYLGFIID